MIANESKSRTQFQHGVRTDSSLQQKNSENFGSETLYISIDLTCNCIYVKTLSHTHIEAHLMILE